MRKIVDKCFYSATPRSVTDIMAALYCQNMSLQALAEKFLSSLQITINERDIIEKLLKNKVTICNGKSFVKGESLHHIFKECTDKFQKF